MDTLLGFLFFLLIIALIVGLIKPSLIMFWSKKPKRIKLVGWWVLTILIIATLTVLIESDKAKIKTAKEDISKQDYSSAIATLELISNDSEYYLTADSLKKQAVILLKEYNDSIKFIEEQKAEAERLAELEAKRAKEQEERNQQIEQLKKEINTINEGVDFSTYQGTIDALQMELVIFSTWASIIQEAENSDDPEIKELARQLKNKVVNIQIKEFPRLRKEYASIAAKEMWENDIEVYSNGPGNTYINFTGGVFAANKNKKDFQEQLHEILTMFRFKQSRYRWYEGEDEFTYWTVFEGRDSDLVNFD